MTLTLTSMQFSPRIIVNFVKDKVTQKTLGIFLGTFAYCVAALPAAHTLPQPFAPVLTVFGAMVLAMCCVGWLLYFIHHISQAISVSHIVDQLAEETCCMVEQMMPLRSQASPCPAALTFKPTGSGASCLLPATQSGYIRYLDLPQLISLAVRHDVQLRVLRRVGEFIPAGVPIVSVNGPAAGALGKIHQALAWCMEIGPTRTLQQDIEFGILQIVDVALKAISPAVNDPSTAVTCVDQLSRILVQVIGRKPSPAQLQDETGMPRVWVSWPDPSRLMDTAFEQIRLYARGDLAVSLRLLKVLGDLAFMVTNPSDWALLCQHGERICHGSRRRMDPGEWKLLEERWDRICSDWPSMRTGSSAPAQPLD
jgi:uncharacterized membrane protein